MKLLERWLGEGGDPATAPSQPSVDPAALQALAELEQNESSDLLEELVDAYLSSSTQLSAQLRDSIAAGDAKSMSVAAHTLKSSSAQIGAMRLSALSKQIESLGRAGSIDGARDLLGELSTELESVHEELAAARFGARDV